LTILVGEEGVLVKSAPGEGHDSAHEVRREYDDIPGTFVFDGRRSRRGYALNKFCMSLNTPANRDALRADPERYLDRFALSPEQREAVTTRNWLRMLELGGNIYYTYKLAAFDGMTFQQLASEQTGVSEEDYVAMMLAGGRPIEGNRSRAGREQAGSEQVGREHAEREKAGRG
jgi:protocatechuate 4,5-dioxygenase alpha chain